MVFALFRSKNGYTLCSFWFGIGYGFRRKKRRIRTYLSFQFQINEQERKKYICLFFDIISAKRPGLKKARKNVILLVWNKAGVKEQGGSNPHQQSPGVPRPLPPPRDFLQVVNNANNGQGLHTRATREKRADRKRNDFKTQVPVTTPPALLSLTPFLFFLAILTTYFNEFTTIYLSQSNT